jgi:hypothetical protein
MVLGMIDCCIQLLAVFALLLIGIFGANAWDKRQKE